MCLLDEGACEIEAFDLISDIGFEGTGLSCGLLPCVDLFVVLSDSVREMGTT